MGVIMPDGSVGFCVVYEICRYCGKKFHYNNCQLEQAVEALKEKEVHEAVCPVRFGREPCPEKWRKELKWAKKDMEKSQRIIDELTKDLTIGVVHPLLREKAKEIIEKKKEEIRACKRRLGEDPDFDEIKKLIEEIEKKEKEK